MRSLKKVVQDVNFWRVDAKRTKAKPFPGKYPTRWWILFQEKSGKVNESVISKPNTVLALKTMRKARFFKGTMTLIEFDLGGAIRRASCHTPTDQALLGHCCGAVAYLYYPWQGILGGYFDVWMRQVFHKKYKHGKRVFFGYSPYEVMLGIEQHVQQLRDYKTWLKKSNPWK